MRDEQAADAALWNQMRSGDADAWGRLFERHAQLVYRFCTRMLGSAQDAEDALSETFLEVWRSKRSFTVRGDSSAPIVLAIAHRVCQKRLRSAKRYALRGAAAAVNVQVSGAGISEDTASSPETTRQQAWLRERVAALPTPQRNVYELVIYAEMSHEEVARLLGVPLGTVKSRMARARQSLHDSARDGQQLTSSTHPYEKAGL